MYDVSAGGGGGEVLVRGLLGVADRVIGVEDELATTERKGVT